MAKQGVARVVILGGGFGGLYTAQSLARAKVEITLIDRRNFHLFQPLLYQVATGGLSPADIASPLRAVLARQSNVRVIQGEVLDIDPAEKRVRLLNASLPYDFLVVATGAGHHYFGNDHWSELAPGLKTIEDATAIRSRLLRAFERAETSADEDERRRLMTFTIIGGGPTGVELAGAIGELAHQTLRRDFRKVDPAEARILLLEGAPRILLGYPEELASKAVQALESLGVEVRVGTLVTDIRPGRLRFKRQGEAAESESDEEELLSETILWAAGIQASPLGKALHRAAGADLDRAGRVIVEADLTLPGHPEIFVVGDLASLRNAPLPGVAPVAMQQGRHAAGSIEARLDGREPKPFRYRDRGSLAVIGRAKAVALLGRFRFSGYPAWWLWLFVHLIHLVEYENRLLVLIQWGWNYFTRNRRARLITGKAD